jgi:hypothetical protein
MFNRNKRFVTESVQEQLQESMIRAFWSMVDSRTNQWPPSDHIQLFNLYVMIQDGNQTQIIEHSQESPEWERAFILTDIQNPLHMKSYWIVDNGEVSILQPYNMQLHDYYRSLKPTRSTEVL